MSEDFSACVIARNEAPVIGRLLASIRGAPEIVVLDTGSRDGTPAIARAAGARVEEAGEAFLETATADDVARFRAVHGWEPTFAPGTRLFDYARARNASMELASYDFCFFPDADEEVSWDVGAIRALLPAADRLRYWFAFSHDAAGRPLLQFLQTKFFRRSRWRWTRKVHEIEELRDGRPERTVRTDALFHHHWQKAGSGNRADYLPKLELASLEDPEDGRRLFYLGREYLGAWELDRAIPTLRRYLERPGWKPERSQAMILLGDAHKFWGLGNEAIRWYHDAIREDSSRREPWFALGQTWFEWNRDALAVPFLRAATEIPAPGDYLNDMELYSWKVWDLLARVYLRLGRRAEARAAWIEALRAAPDDPRILANGRWYAGDAP